MSGSRSQYGLAQQGMLPYGQWVHEDGRPSTALYSFISTLWKLAGGSSAPVDSATGQSGVPVLESSITELQTEIDALQNSVFGLGEIPDAVDIVIPTVNYAEPGELADTVVSQAKSTSVSFKASGLIAGDTFFTAQVPCKIVGVMGRLNVANAGAATLTPAIVPSGTAVSAGSAISSSLNLAGTANTNQTLTQTSAIKCSAGDSLGLLGTGVIVAATGTITVFYVEI